MRKDLKKINKRKAVFLAFKECLRMSELALAMKIWFLYNPLLKYKQDELLDLLVECFV